MIVECIIQLQCGQVNIIVGTMHRSISEYNLKMSVDKPIMKQSVATPEHLNSILEGETN